MPVWEREQKLRPARMAEGRPLVGERQDLEAARVDDLLVLGCVDRADRVDDRAARPEALGRGADERELQLGERARAPAQVAVQLGLF